MRNSGQATQFLGDPKRNKGQGLTWTVTAFGGSVLATRIPNPHYGDQTYWSAPVHSTTVDLNGDGVVNAWTTCGTWTTSRQQASRSPPARP